MPIGAQATHTPHKEESKMRKVINGKVYDTEKAELIAECGDIQLFRKRTGEYFAHTGSGNQALSSIRPMTPEQARAWAEKELPEEQVSHIFAEPADGEKVQLGIRVSAASAARLQRVALDRGISQAELLDNWIQNGI
ncbi:MAG: hypothetical protein IIU04_06375 [Bacteroidales bacterium]|nr:hypothetical protein [Bacteroidales bacterium]